MSIIFYNGYTLLLFMILFNIVILKKNKLEIKDKPIINIPKDIRFNPFIKSEINNINILNDYTKNNRKLDNKTQNENNTLKENEEEDSNDDLINVILIVASIVIGICIIVVIIFIVLIIKYPDKYGYKRIKSTQVESIQNIQQRNDEKGLKFEKIKKVEES